MEIRLDCGEWHMNGYVIEGDYEVGYSVYPEDAPYGAMSVYDSDNFEECLTWVYNS